MLTACLLPACFTQLECLEAEFYSYAAYGYGISDELRGYGPEPIGGMKAALSPTVQAYAEEVANNEIAHVADLRAALGDAAPACPQIDIGPAFAAAANAAVGSELSPPYSPYYNDAWFLLGAFIFEDVGECRCLRKCGRSTVTAGLQVWYVCVRGLQQQMDCINCSGTLYMRTTDIVGQHCEDKMLQHV